MLTDNQLITCNTYENIDIHWPLEDGLGTTNFTNLYPTICVRISLNLHKFYYSSHLD